MSISVLATEMLSAVRAQGQAAAFVAVSPDLYDLGQQENDGVEPTAVLGLPIRIRDNYKPRTMLILGERIEEPKPSGITLDGVMSNIERGSYGPDAEAAVLVRSALRDGATPECGGKIMKEFYDSLERGRERFASDALQAVGLASHPCAEEIFCFAEKMLEYEADETKHLAILRRLAGFIHAASGSQGTQTEH